ncbi:hypothetical protein TPHA_0L02340 [Tetrapisispora phaffii CBS 4417]|uniref:ER-derived vesicles protein ERV29 n=1 Tax=Tetrapisispora phaffii (strain ATCC 24235 / CBS 4417 / NBRC 1672 / NRRL Y-8282 / UCD 70-5) TaxID=1071381 RepID=G8C0A7_TETPH|nr:hypothetical protein TPHA_0L02340 [Tetrapisispora phaffii CBS 4417]CCE65585.1 hypothetical protein TPHA_0L02340 [Tetrapisispora phaffii CBS 4417]
MSFRGPQNSGFSNMNPNNVSYNSGLRNGGYQNAAKYGKKGFSTAKLDFQKADQLIDKWLKPLEKLNETPLFMKVKPYIPNIAQFFIVATFYEDTLRICTQWSDQVFYLNQWKHYPYFFVVLFLSIVSLSMFGAATLLILKKHTIYATGVLCASIALQSLVYGLSTGSSFILRNFSVIGALLINFSDSIVNNKVTFQMLPELNNRNEKNKGYLLLAGRMLIVLMFIGFTFSKSWFTVLFTIVFTAFFAIGYKTKISSIMLVLILALYNITVNNYWFHDASQRDFLKYEFFQNLSIIGALLLVTNTGAGEISIDSKKKIY